MMNEFHTFSITFAQKYGVHEAILMNHFYFWCEQNQLSGKNFKDGKTWTYVSVSDLTKRFVYMSESKIRTAIKNLVKEKILVEGTFNKISFDRTKWYAITDEGYNIYNECTKEINNSEKVLHDYLNPCKKLGRKISTKKQFEKITSLPFDVAENIKKEILNMPYKTFLKTPYWKAVRGICLLNAEYKCTVCNSNKGLNVHHKTYEHHGEEAKYTDDLIVLCRNCHEKFHNIFKECE